MVGQRAVGSSRRRQTVAPDRAALLVRVPRPLLRVECLRCFRTVEIQKADAVRLYGPHAVLKGVGLMLLEYGCQARTGRGGRRLLAGLGGVIYSTINAISNPGASIFFKPSTP
jgi:hypothetical protein